MKDLIQVFVLDDSKLRGFWGYLDYTMVKKQINQAKLNKSKIY